MSAPLSPVTQQIPRKRGNPELNAMLSHTEEKTHSAFKSEAATKPANKCQYSTCNRYLTPSMRTVKCVCEKSFCANHRSPKDHDCRIDWRDFDVKRARSRKVSQNGFIDSDGDGVS